jgi:hypothetical protein
MTGVALLDRSLDQASAPNHAANRGFTLHPSLKNPAVMNYAG